MDSKQLILTAAIFQPPPPTSKFICLHFYRWQYQRCFNRRVGPGSFQIDLLAQSYSRRPLNCLWYLYPKSSAAPLPRLQQAAPSDALISNPFTIRRRIAPFVPSDASSSSSKWLLPSVIASGEDGEMMQRPSPSKRYSLFSMLLS